MNNKIKHIALAVGLACAGGAATAQSSITLQGLVDVNVQRIDQNGPGYPVADRGDRSAVDSNGMTTSWWGITGTETLSPTLRANFALQGFFRPDTGEGGRFGTTDILFKRAAWVGLDMTGVGRLQAGRQSTQYFLAAVQTNPFGDSFGYSPMILNTFGTAFDPNAALPGGLGVSDPRRSFILNDSGWSNSVQVMSPVWSGFSAAAMYSFASGSNDQEDPINSSRGKAWSGQLSYRSGPLVAVGVYQDININGNSPPAASKREQTAWLLGAAYDLKVVRLFAQYQSITTDINVGGDEDTSWQLGFSAPFGKHRVLGSYVRTDTDAQVGTAPSEKRTTWTVGYGYDFSRRTDGYINYLSDDLDAPLAKDRTIIGVGLRHRF
jgi:predicted porin